VSIIPAEVYETIARQPDGQPEEEIARITEEHTRGIAEGLGGIGGIRVIVAQDGHAHRRGGVQPPFALLSIPNPWIAIILSEMMHQEDTYTMMECHWALYPAGEPTEALWRMVGPDRAHILEPHEHLWCLEPIPDGVSDAAATDWLRRAHEDCARFETKAAEMSEAAEGALAELREDAALRIDEDLRKPPAPKPQWERMLLPRGAMLAALLYPRDLDKLPDDRRRFLLEADHLGQRALVPFTTLEPLILVQSGARRPGLRPCRCQIPVLRAEAESVNHAYTRITEVFQPTRHSKVGNVFREVVVMHHGKWTPLETLRKDVEANVTAGR